MIVLAIILVVGFVVWWFWLRDGISQLNKPIGEMTLERAPYGTLNGAAETPGHIDQNGYIHRLVYGRYGYRAIRKDDFGEIIEDRSSDIKWNSKVYKVFDPSEPEDSGFTFSVPRQANDLISNSIFYQLVGTFFDSEDESGETFFEEIPLGEVISNDTERILVESSDPAINKNLGS